MSSPPVPLPPPLADTLAGYRWTRDAAGESGGAVFRLDRAGAPSLFLKAGEGRVADDIADEAARLRWLAGRVPTAALVHFAATATGAWLVTRAVPGRSADEWIADDPGRLAMLVPALAAFLRRLHALPVADCPFDAGPARRMAAARANLLAGRIDMDDVDDEHRGWTPERLWDKLVALAPDTIDPVVTHGDFSLGNILFDAAGDVTGCIDLGRLGVADRYQDLAILWQNLSEFGDDLPARFLRAYGIAAADERRLAFHRCLDEFF